MRSAAATFAGTERYEPVTLLGMGGMGAVYQVYDRATDSHAALKILLVNDPWNLLRFKKEFRLLAELQHRNLVRLYDLGQHQGQWFFTMELVRGRDLVSALDVRGREPRGPDRKKTELVTVPGTELTVALRAAEVDPPVVRTKRDPACDLTAFVNAMDQLLEGLGFLHHHGIVHRDLKPSNVMMDAEGNVRLLDFGLANRLDEALGISEEGAIAGTLAYLSPERYRGAPGSVASDLYAVGCMMFELLAGELPFLGSLQYALSNRLEKKAPTVDSLVNGVPSRWVEVIAGLLEIEPKNRPTLAQVRAALRTSDETMDTRAEDADGDALRSTSERRALRESGEFFVGRRDEQHSLTQALQRAAAGKSQFALVSGPSGIGKSSLASVLLAQAKSSGFMCLSGKLYEREQLPYVAFDRLIDSFALTLSRWEYEKLAPLREPLLILERIFPTLNILTLTPTGTRSSEVNGDPRALRQQCIESLQQLLSMCQVHTPLCLVFDDLQWADQDSFDLLEALIERNLGRVMMICLARTEGVEQGGPYARFVSKIADSRAYTKLELAPLTPTETADLLASVSDNRLKPAVVQALSTQFDGNPLLLRRLAEHLATMGDHAQSDELHGLESIEKLLLALIAPLSAEAKSLLAIAATAGSELSVSVLQRVSGLSREAFEHALSELSASKMVRSFPAQMHAGAPEQEPDRVVDVYHDKLRTVAYEHIEPSERAAIHGQLARALQHKSSIVARDAEALVRHWVAANEPHEYRRSALEAAELAASKLAFHHAAQLLRAVLSTTKADEDSSEQMRLWERAGDLFVCSGKRTEALEAFEFARAEVERRKPSGDSAELMRTVDLLRIHGKLLAHYSSVGAIDRANTSCEAGFALAGIAFERSFAGRVATLAALQLRNRLAGVWTAKTARSTEERALLAAKIFFFDVATQSLQALLPMVSAECALRCELLGRESNDARTLQRSLAFSAVVPLILDQGTSEKIAKAHAELDRAEQWAVDESIPLGRQVVLMNRGLVWLCSDWDRAKQSCALAMKELSERGLIDSFEGRLACGYYLLILYFRGDYEEVITFGEQMLQLEDKVLPLQTVARLMSSRVQSRWGRAEQGLATAQAHLASLAHFAWTRLHFSSHQAIAEALVFLGKSAQALELEPMVEQNTSNDGTWRIAADRSMWVATMIEARLQLLAAGQLSSKEQRKLSVQAQWLADAGFLDYPVLGYRAQALLAHNEAKHKLAEKYRTQMLDASLQRTCPYHRWLCLHSAKTLRALSLTEGQELETLSKVHRFALPRPLAGK